MANNNAEKDFKDMKNIYKSKVLKKLDIVEELGRILNIPAPYHIEAFDNSNLFGEYPVSAMVVFKMVDQALRIIVNIISKQLKVPMITSQ